MSGVLHAIFNYFETHPGRDFLVYWILMVMIDQLPAPSGSNPFYKWFFGVTHVFSASLTRGRKGVAGELAHSGSQPEAKNG